MLKSGALKKSSRSDIKSQPPFDCFNPALSDSDSGEFYVHPKCFRGADATVNSVSANSNSKIFDTANLADSDKPKNLEIADSNSVVS